MVRESFKLQFRVVAKSARFIFAHKNFLFFPFASMAFASTVLSFFYFTVGPDKMQLMLNTLRNEQGVQTINASYYGALAVALYLIVAFSTAMNLALTACIRLGLEGEQATIWDGLTAAVRRAPAVFLWSAVSLSVGALWTLFDQERRSSAILRRRFGNTWSIISTLTVPVAVSERRNVFSALFRSRTLMHATWGENVSARFGTFWLVAMLSVPLWVKYILLKLAGTGITLPFAEFVLVYIACSLILAQTAKAIFKVVLYRFAAEGVVVEGFDRRTLEDAFVNHDSPKPSRSLASRNPAVDAVPQPEH